MAKIKNLGGAVSNFLSQFRSKNKTQCDKPSSKSKSCKPSRKTDKHDKLPKNGNCIFPKKKCID